MGSGQQEKPSKSTNSIPKFWAVLLTAASIWGYLTVIIHPKKGAYFILESENRFLVHPGYYNPSYFFPYG
jgi:hypothetical protein